MMNGKQCKMARTALGVSVRALADMCDISPATVHLFEKGRDSYRSTVESMQKQLEQYRTAEGGRVEFHGDCVCWIESENE